jgi:hypothetical protein
LGWEKRRRREVVDRDQPKMKEGQKVSQIEMLWRIALQHPRVPGK